MSHPPPPVLPYAGTSGWTGSETSRDRALAEDAEGVTADRQSRVVRHLYWVGRTGATWKEIASEFGWHHGQASGVLSVLHKEDKIARLYDRRERCAVYVHPDHVNRRETAPHGRTAATLPDLTPEERVALSHVAASAEFIHNEKLRGYVKTVLDLVERAYG